MAAVWEEIFTLSQTATHSGDGTSNQSDEDTFSNAYLWITYSVEYSSSLTFGGAYYTAVSWGLVDITNGKRLEVNAAGDSTITVTVTYYGVRLSDDEAFGLATPVLERRIT